MATPVKMPELGESITEGTITRWLKQEGDHVEADEPLFEVSTDKVDTEVPSPVSGTLTAIKAKQDETVEVGAELAIIEQDGQAGGEASPAGERAGEQGAEERPGQREPAAAGAATGRAANGRPSGPEEDGEQRPAAEQPAEPAEQRRAPAAEAGQDGEVGQGGDQDAGGETTVTMPELGESITEGTITRWLKQEGDHVEADEPLFEVSTDKVDTEVPSPVSGTLTAIKAKQDETVEVGAELAVISTGARLAGAAAAGTRAAEAEATPGATEAEATPGEAEATPGAAAAAGEAEQPEAAPAEREPAEAAEREPAAAAAAAAPGGDGATGDGKGAGVVSPLVRRLAREHDVDLSQVQGTGSGGRVRRQDIEAYLERRTARPAAAAPGGDGKGAAATAERAAPAEGRAAAARQAPPPTTAVPLAKGIREEVTPATRLRRIIAERMVASLQTSAQLTAAVEIDMTRVMRLRARARAAFKAREGVSLSPLPFAILAVIEAIHTYPRANSSLDQDFNLHVYQDVNMGIAVDTPKGLFVPVIRNADALNLAGLARAVADLAKRTREGRIDPGELAGSTFTVTNTGSVGTVWDTPIINQPNAAIFATPAIVRRPVVVDDPELGEVIAVRHMMYGVLTYDHRVLDGADAARFLVRVKEVLEAGDFERELGLPAEG